MDRIGHLPRTLPSPKEPWSLPHVMAGRLSPSLGIWPEQKTDYLRPRVAGYVGYDIRCIFPELPPTVGYAVTRG